MWHGKNKQYFFNKMNPNKPTFVHAKRRRYNNLHKEYTLINEIEYKLDPMLEQKGMTFDHDF